MREVYKGLIIEITRERCLGGWDNTYLSVFRKEDGLEVICEITDAEDPLRFFMKIMKERIDGFIETEGKSELLSEYY